MTTFAVSVSAFVLSIVANIWTFAISWVRWPRVSVEMRAYVYGSFGRTGPAVGQNRMVVTVINRGSEAITISNIGLEAENGSCRRDFEYDEIHNPEFLPDTNHDPLPLRLEGHGVLRWIYGPSQLSSFPNGEMVTAYAKIYRSFRWGRSVTERRIYASEGRLKQ